MKTTLLVITILFAVQLNAQDKSKIKTIDSIVNLIKQGSFTVKEDSVTSAYAQYGLYMKHYLIFTSKGKELKRYAQLMNATKTENDTAIVTKTGNVFYYDRDHLVKVEEYMVSGSIQKHVDWYFEKDKCIYVTPKIAGYESRITMLIEMGNTVLKTFKGQ